MQLSTVRLFLESMGNWTCKLVPAAQIFANRKKQCQVIFVRTSYGKYQSMLISIIIRFGNGGKEYVTCKRWTFDAVMSKWNEEQRAREWGSGLSFFEKHL